MQPRNYKPLFRDLSSNERDFFFLEEMYEGNKPMKKWIMCIGIPLSIIEVTIFGINFSRQPLASWKPSCYSSMAVIILSGILYSVSLLKPLATQKSSAIFLRKSIMTLASICFSVSIALIVRMFINIAVEENQPRNWFDAIVFMSKGIFIAIFNSVTMALWQLKICCPIGFFLAILISYIESGLPDSSLIIAQTIAAMIYISALFYMIDHFKRRLFIQRAEADDWNRIYQSILDKVNDAILVVDCSGTPIFSNREFKQVSRGNYDTFFQKIVRLKKRTDILSFENEQIFSILESPKLANNETTKFKFFDSFKLSNDLPSSKLQPSSIKDLKELIEISIQNLKEGRLTHETFFTFDARYVEERNSQNSTQGRQYEVTLSPMEISQKIILVLRDTTQHAQLVALENNNQYKDKLLASVSHELKTPLNGNLGLLETAISSADIPHTAKERFLIPAYRSGKLLAHLINDIVDYSQIATKKLRMVFEDFSLRETLNTCYQLVETQATIKGLSLSLNFDKNIPESFITDHDRLRQIILNLLTNAMKFTFQGSIILKASLATENQVEICVEDSGIGIKEDDIEKLFREFERGEEEEETDMISKGAGLGLTIANKLAKYLGPEGGPGISASGIFNKGSCFRFTIEAKELLNNADDMTKIRGYLQTEKFNPQSSNNCSMEYIETLSSHRLEDHNISQIKFKPKKLSKYQQQIPIFSWIPSNSQKSGLARKKPFLSHLQTDESRTLELNKGKILVVDDDPFNILALKAILHGLGMSVESAFNGEDAVNKVIEQCSGATATARESSRFQVIFMDCQMPVMDGYKATEKLCELMKTIGEIPIIGCTAFTAKSRIDDCFRCGMKDVINKPVSREKISRILKKHMKQTLAQENVLENV